MPISNRFAGLPVEKPTYNKSSPGAATSKVAKAVPVKTAPAPKAAQNSPASLKAAAVAAVVFPRPVGSLPIAPSSGGALTVFNGNSELFDSDAFMPLPATPPSLRQPPRVVVLERLSDSNSDVVSNNILPCGVKCLQGLINRGLVINSDIIMMIRQVNANIAINSDIIMMMIQANADRAITVAAGATTELLLGFASTQTAITSRVAGLLDSTTEAMSQQQENVGNDESYSTQAAVVAVAGVVVTGAALLYFVSRLSVVQKGVETVRNYFNPPAELPK